MSIGDNVLSEQEYKYLSSSFAKTDDFDKLKEAVDRIKGYLSSAGNIVSSYDVSYSSGKLVFSNAVSSARIATVENGGSKIKFVSAGVT